MNYNFNYVYSHKLYRRVHEKNKKKSFLFVATLVTSLNVLFEYKNLPISAIFVALFFFLISVFYIVESEITLLKKKRLFDGNLLKIHMSDDFVEMESKGFHFKKNWAEIGSVKKYKEAWCFLDKKGYIIFIIPTGIIKEEAENLLNLELKEKLFSG